MRLGKKVDPVTKVSEDTARTVVSLLGYLKRLSIYDKGPHKSKTAWTFNKFVLELIPISKFSPVCAGSR